MGGGVIIKPVFDAIGAHDVVSISFYSSMAVFTMSIVSTIRQVKNGIHFHKKRAPITIIGSIIGGYLGNATFEMLLVLLQSESAVQFIQIVLTICSLVFSLLYTIKKWPSFQLNSLWWYLVTGILLGFLASLLGIGGGPINVALLMLCFNIPIKSATAYSIFIILFSQFTKLVSIGFTTGYGHFDLTMLYAIIPASIIGGTLGARLSKVLVEQTVARSYQAIIILVIVLNITNGISLY